MCAYSSVDEFVSIRQAHLIMCILFVCVYILTFSKPFLPSVTSCPLMYACPLVALALPLNMWMVVVFPAPFGPSKANTSPVFIPTEIPLTATLGGYDCAKTFLNLTSLIATSALFSPLTRSSSLTHLHPSAFPFV